MTFTVIWLHRLEPDLTRMYLHARGNGLAEAVVRATSVIDQQLRTDPNGVGESRAGRTRLLIEEPMWVEYEVHPDEQAVIVTSVRYRPPQR
jgi:hypothetical protein